MVSRSDDGPGMSLQERIGAVSMRAKADGVLSPLQTDVHTVEEAGLQLELRCVSNLDLKPRRDRGASAAGHNPFLPFDPALHVADIAGDDAEGRGRSSHVLLLNKFPVVDHHVVLITRDFESQLAWPSRRDFQAVAQLLAELDGLVFYNGGPLAGASQHHRHFQQVPLVPRIQPAVLAAPPIGTVPALPFRHCLVRFCEAATAAPRDLAQALQDAFTRAATFLRFDVQQPMLPPCNLLCGRGWLMLIPRTREHCQLGEVTLSVNALGFAGHLLLRSQEQLQALLRHGVLSALVSVT